MTDNKEFLIAEELFNDEKYEEAFRIYKKLAESGSVDSQVFLGWMYQRGLGVKKDANVAFRWYEQAAKLGSSEAQFYLAKAYSGKSEYAMAMNWYSKAASNSYSPALFRLGWIYDTGRGVNTDKKKAFEYFKRAAELGHVFGKKEYALYLMRGYDGFISRLKGILIFIKCFILIIMIGIKDPHSEKLKD